MPKKQLFSLWAAALLLSCGDRGSDALPFDADAVDSVLTLSPHNAVTARSVTHRDGRGQLRVDYVADGGGILRESRRELTVKDPGGHVVSQTLFAPDGVMLSVTTYLRDSQGLILRYDVGSPQGSTTVTMERDSAGRVLAMDSVPMVFDSVPMALGEAFESGPDARVRTIYDYDAQGREVQCAQCVVRGDGSLAPFRRTLTTYADSRFPSSVTQQQLDSLGQWLTHSVDSFARSQSEVVRLHRVRGCAAERHVTELNPQGLAVRRRSFVARSADADTSGIDIDIAPEEWRQTSETTWERSANVLTERRFVIDDGGKPQLVETVVTYYSWER